MRLTAIKSQIIAFVLLPYMLDIDEWEASYLRGEVPDKSPYGYHYAENSACLVRFSKSLADRFTVFRLLRSATQKLLGFDFLHAWQQRDEIFSSDVVWTHTEKEHLAVELLFIFIRRQRPKLIAQSVWLFDNWRQYFWLRKVFYKALLRQASILTVLSPENQTIAESLKLQLECRVVKFGVSMEAFPLRQIIKTQFHNPIRVLTLGNDRDRDWYTFFDAIKDNPNFEIHVISRNFPPELTSGNLSIYQGNLIKVKEFYNWADVVVVPLKCNYHASGITVILEAVSSGLPVVATDTGGLKAYFEAGEVSYVAEGNSKALHDALIQLGRAPDACLLQTQMAQQRLLHDGYTSHHFALLHRKISLELLRSRLCE